MDKFGDFRLLTMNNFYPRLQFRQHYKELVSGNLDILRPKEPSVPEDLVLIPKVKIELKTWLLTITALVFLSLYVRSALIENWIAGLPWFWIALFFLILSIFSLREFIQARTHNDQINKTLEYSHLTSVINYPSEKLRFEKDQEQILYWARTIQNQQQLRPERLRILDVLFAQRIPNPTLPEKANKDTKRGISETFFMPYLEHRFPNQVHTGLSIKFNYTESYKIEYSPDFVLWIKAENIIIDIEIDEPYTMGSRKPIHFDDIDAGRDNFLCENGWYVIRFAEEQILRYPQACIELLEIFIEGLKSFETCEKIHFNVDEAELIIIQSWTFDQASQMAKNSYRMQYYQESGHASFLKGHAVIGL